MKYSKLRRDALERQCRECINEGYGLSLTRRDCRYWHYPTTCARCGNVGNIVTDIAPFSRIKVFLAKKP